MKRLIVIVLVLLLLTGGGAGALIMLGIVHNPFAPKAVEMSAAEKAASEADKKNKFQPLASAMKFVKMDDTIIPVIIDGQVAWRVFINARIVAAQPSADKDIKAGKDLFENAVISDLIPYFQDYFATHDVVDPVVVKQKLVAHAKEIYGDKVSDVLLSNVFAEHTGRD